MPVASLTTKCPPSVGSTRHGAGKLRALLILILQLYRYLAHAILNAAVLLVAPLVRHSLEKGRINEAIELIDVHGVDAILKTLVFGLVAPDRLLVLATLVGMAGVQRVTHPFENLVIEFQPTSNSVISHHC
jgi:hypothetical protein